MTAVWTTVAGLMVGTVAIKAAGPLALGGRDLPAAATGVISLLAPALLAALIVANTFVGDGQELSVDARAVGLGCAAGASVLRAPLIVTVGVAAAGTAVARAVV